MDDGRARPSQRAHRLARARPGSLLVGLLAVVAVACGADDDGGALSGVVRHPALDVAAVQFPAADDGRMVPMQAPPGELLVVYFGYTSCPDICPTTMSDLSIAVHDLPDELAERVTTVFATVDPDRDTADVLGEYLGHFFADGLTLRTEDADELAAAATAFGVQYEVADHRPGDRTYEVAHTAVTYVVDDTGTVAVEWPFGFETSRMTADLRALLEKEST